jgi:uncharacterized membrane-anchored protein
MANDRKEETAMLQGMLRFWKHPGAHVVVGRAALAYFVVVVCLISLTGVCRADNPPDSSTPPIQWSRGPMTARLGSIAEIDVPKGYVFADGDGARKVLELTHNPSSGAELGIIAPQSDKESWFVLFEFNDVGYVKDDEKESLDAAKILANIQEGTEEANEERQKRGWKAFHVNGWYTPPYYDSETNNLTWAVNGSEDNGTNPSINYSVRILGRRGTMNVDLVLDPNDMAATEPRFKALMSAFHYTGGNRYADFAQGDKIASYGLTALIAGGATAVAIKTGLFAKLWKLIIVLFLAIISAIKKLWNKARSAVTGSRDPEDEFPRSIQGPDQGHVDS